LAGYCGNDHIEPALISEIFIVLEEKAPATAIKNV
jgi:hypothetical protein